MSEFELETPQDDCMYQTGYAWGGEGQKLSK